MPAQPWLTTLDPVSKRAFAIAAKSATDAQRETIRRFIERPREAFPQHANARLIASLLAGHGTITKEPVPVATLCQAIDQWFAHQGEFSISTPNPVTLISFVDDLVDAELRTVAKRRLEQAPLTSGFQCASLRNWDPTSPVWVRDIGMVDIKDPRHPRSGSPMAAVERRGQYYLPAVPAGTPSGGPTPAVTP